MKQILQYFIFVFAMLCVAAGCKKDDAVKKNSSDPKLVQSTIAGVNGPTTGAVNETLTFSVVWQNTDGLAKFDHIQDSTLLNTKMIKVFALTNVNDSVALKEQNTIPYTFKATIPGTYYLKFYKADNSEKTAIIDTLHIK